MCLDAQWQEWLASAFEGRAPKITSVGYAYMLTANEWGSNIDPMGAKEPTATNQWHKQGPHVMMLYPDSKLLAGVPTVPSTTGPYVMMAGTPHAHVMWPMRQGWLDGVYLARSPAEVGLTPLQCGSRDGCNPSLMVGARKQRVPFV